MKQKKIYLYLAALIILMLISILISRKNTIKTASEETESPEIESPQIAVQRQGLETLDQARKISSVSHHRPAITIIRPPPKNNPLFSASEEKISQRQKSESSSISSAQAPVVSQEKPNDSPADSGITKIGNQPSEKEKQEMDAQGIMIY